MASVVIWETNSFLSDISNLHENLDFFNTLVSDFLISVAYSYIAIFMSFLNSELSFIFVRFTFSVTEIFLIVVGMTEKTVPINFVFSFP